MVPIIVLLGVYDCGDRSQNAPVDGLCAVLSDIDLAAQVLAPDHASTPSG
jgi:hypothetical protein